MISRTIVCRPRVWAVTARLPGKIDVPGVANLGLRPTVDGRCRTFEVHLFDFSGDLYGQELEITFRQHLRSEIRFPSLDALQEQIRKDAALAREILSTDPK